jgi:competence ComEA-like helix-hairpin-helix protein
MRSFSRRSMTWGKAVLVWNLTAKIFCLLFAAAALAGAIASDDEARDLPDGPGKETVAKVCIDCHTAGTFRKMRFNEAEWEDKVGDMVDRGAKADEKQQAEIVAYLVRNFGPGAKVNMNTAPLSELMVVLGFTADESKALVAYRTGHGAFKDWSEVARVSGVDAKKVESQKDKMAF